MKPIGPKIAYEKLIANIIRQWQYDVIYKPVLNILDKRVVLNDSQIIIHAIQSGNLYYQDGAFYSITGRFSNNIALELEKLGAKYSKYRRCYKLSKEKINSVLLWYIENEKAQTLAKVAIVSEFLKNASANIKKELATLVMEEAVEAIFYDLQTRIEKNYREAKIETISPKLTDFRAKEIADNYINNLKFWIQEWELAQITKMREAISQMAIEGKSQKSVADYIQKQFNITDRHKAEFLARNETAIATSSYLSAKYQEDGFTHFKWHTIMDSRARDSHKKLNGHIFPFNEPPIIDDRTGQRGLPGETYNCRCAMSPVLEKFKDILEDVNIEQ